MTEKGEGKGLKAQTATKPHTSASVHLDAIRGLAALLVFFGHLRALFFVPYPGVLRPDALVTALYIVDGFGHASVIVFFVLSGYLISSSVFRSLETERWSWGWYAQNRLTRLYVVLIPALLLCAFWDRLGMGLFGLDGAYGGSRHYSNILPGNIPPLSSVGIWLGNLFFLQTILVPTFGSDVPLWSLSCEFWYYLLFPLCLFILSGRLPVRVRLVYALAAVAAASFIGKGILLSFPIWLMGTALCLLPAVRPATRRWLCPLATLLLLGALLVHRSHQMTSALGCDYLVATTFTLFLYGVLGNRSCLPALYERAARFLSGISYTLYLVHMPFLFFVTASVIGPKTLWQPTAPHLGLGLAVAVATLAYVYLVWRLTEANTDQVRRYIAAKLSRPLRSAPLPQARRPDPARPGRLREHDPL